MKKKRNLIPFITFSQNCLIITELGKMSIARARKPSEERTSCSLKKKKNIRSTDFSRISKTMKQLHI